MISVKKVGDAVITKTVLPAKPMAYSNIFEANARIKVLEAQLKAFRFNDGAVTTVAKETIRDHVVYRIRTEVMGKEYIHFLHRASNGVVRLHDLVSDHTYVWTPLDGKNLTLGEFQAMVTQADPFPLNSTNHHWTASRVRLDIRSSTTV